VSSQHVHGTVPSPSEFNPTIPADLQAIVMEALAKSPERRYQSAEDLRSDLVRFSEGQPVRAAQRDVAFFGQDATRAVSKVAPGERTQAVPMMTGPRTDVRRRGNRSANVIVIVVILLLIVGGLAYFLTKKSAPPSVAMPTLVGKTENAALQKMANQGIKLDTKVVSIHSATVVVGSVISTDPKAGVMLTKGEHVILTISLGAQAAPITIPSVKNLSLAAATNELDSKPYFLTVHTGFLQTVPVGVTNSNPNIVISQVPAAGTKGLTGGTITVYVLSPSAQYQVPSLVGKTTLQASAVLGQSNLTLGPTTSTACSDTVGIGLVISSKPAAGAFVNSGDQITLTTSTGYCKIQVPSVIAESQSQATNILKGDHFSVSVSPTDPSTCSPSQVGFVTSESLGIGTHVPYNSTITISVCDASTETTTTTVPPTTTTT
jgi:beta-lactam-binding protein with PASTA domain